MAGIGYPGTPSTETLEYFAKLPGVYAEWTPNEKVALEVAAGVSFAGSRVLVTMKHVGVNVAADPLFTLAYTGVRGGIVLLAADDPGMHSSQNEQDSHNYAAFARVPMLDPSDSSEALAFTREAFEISERFDLPVMIRSTVRVSHAKSLVEPGERVEIEPPAEYSANQQKWVMMPAMARGRRLDLDKRMEELQVFAEETALNRVEMRDSSVGIVCAGASYFHVREALPEASIFKLGLTFPLPKQRLADFADAVDHLYVVEEAEEYLARSLRSFGITAEPLPLPKAGELTPAIIGKAFGAHAEKLREQIVGLPARPPMLCAGCPHRLVFHSLRKAKAVVTGDIGCYTLAAGKPLSAIDSCVCMGASIGMAHGIEIAGGLGGRPVVAVIGDSTFAHSGVTGVMNTVYNGGAGVIAILDNRITAMTGHQGNPVNGITLQTRPSKEIDLEALVGALDVGRVRVVDPHDLSAVQTALAEEIEAEELSVLIFRAPCALLLKQKQEPYAVDESSCRKCGSCYQIGCPAISKDDDGGFARIDALSCVGCAQCVQVCRFGAIVRTGSACGSTGSEA